MPEYDYAAEVAAQDTDDLLDDLEGVEANLRRTTSSIPERAAWGHAAFLRWHSAIVAELVKRGIALPAGKPKKAKKRKAKTA